ncbi:hypothetical protein TrST_g10465 [Triparma strigata]|uniref:Uncharacterized protein n=1 Tax=Triparma strigata TaxID=1606541 RepID=A0A9W7B8I1_9STRA|nr:hypothetical protein TrST_g10465 [Triparma strigata]
MRLSLLLLLVTLTALLVDNANGWSKPFLRKFKKPAKNLLKLTTVLSPVLLPSPCLAQISDTRELTSTQSSLSTLTTTLGFGSTCYLIKRSNDKTDRLERKRVKGEIESFKLLKAEFFNVTAEVESDDSFMEGLRKASNNVTLEEGDDDTDSSSDDDRSGGNDKPKGPSGTDGGNTIKMADDEAVERMKKMFGSTPTSEDPGTDSRPKRKSRFDTNKDDNDNDSTNEGTKNKGTGSRDSSSSTGILDRPPPSSSSSDDGGGVIDRPSSNDENVKRVIKKPPKGERKIPDKLASESDVEKLKRMMGGM